MEDRIRNLVNCGWGRRRIATELGISEYKVRAIMRGFVTDNLRPDDNNTYSGRLRLGKITKGTDKKKTAFVVNDIHVPYHDRRALAIFLEHMKDAKPDTIILNGDIIDFYACSRFLKDPMRIDTLQYELDETKALITHIRREHPSADIKFVKGNHEARLENFLIERASALTSLRCLSLDDLLGFTENCIEFTDGSFSLGDLEVTHGTFARKQPGASVRGHFEKSASSTLIGHVHRLNIQMHRNKWGTHTLVENGHLSDMNPEYTHFPNWQQGYSSIEYSEKTGKFHVTLHVIIDGEMTVGDKVYKAKWDGKKI